MSAITTRNFSFNYQVVDKFDKNNLSNIPEEFNIEEEVNIESDKDIQPSEKEMDIEESKPKKMQRTARRTQKTGRSYLPDGPNVTRTEEERAAGIFSDNNIIQHAGNRIVDFLLSAEVLWELNLTSTPGEKRDLVVKILSALYQGEKGVNIKKKGEAAQKSHGGHDNAGAGLDINIRSSLIEGIIKKGEITPKTQKIMQYRGFLGTDFEEIKENFDKNNVEAVFKRVWRAHPKRPDYVFEGTKINEKVNRTTEISMDVNLFVDKKLEAYIRPIIIILYEKILNGILTPRAATKEYVTAILYFFTKLEKNLKTILTLVEEYQKEFALIVDYNTIPAENCKMILNNLNTIMQKLCPAKPKKAGGIKKKSRKRGKAKAVETEVSQAPTSPPGSPNPSFNPRKIRMNKEFIRQNNLEKDNPELLPKMLRGVQNWGQKRGSALLEEMKDFYKQIETYAKSVVLEKNGTVDVDDDQYTVLFGEFNPKSGKREVTDASIEAARARLWAPPTPQNKRPLEDKETSNPKPPKMRRLSLN